MNWIRLLVLMAVGASHGAVHAEETPEQLIVPPGQVIIQAKGVVCSFCAYGVQKNLAKLKFVDATQFRKGVLMDIHANRITLALDPHQPLDLKGIYQAIQKGGYDPVRLYLRLAGRVTQQGDRYVLRATETGQLFALSGSELKPLSDQQAVDLQAHLDASQIPALPEGQPVEVVVDKLEASS